MVTSRQKSSFVFSRQDRAQAHGVQLLGIKQDEQAVLELVSAVEQGSPALVENRWIGLVIGRRNGEDLANRVY
jgi:hypothetical protein